MPASRKRRQQGTASITKRRLARPKMVMIGEEVVEITEVYDIAVKVPLGAGLDGRMRYATKRKRGELTKADAERVALELRSDVAAGKIELPRVDGPTAVNWIARTIDAMEAIGEQREKVADNNRRHLRNHIAPLLGSTPLTALTTDSLQSLVIALSEKGLSPSSVRGVMAVVSRATRHAKEMKVLTDNPYPGVKLPKRAKVKKKALPDEKIRAVLEELGEATGPVIAFLAATGCRRSEALALTWDGVDFQKREITFSKALNYVPGLAGRVKRAAAAAGKELDDLDPRTKGLVLVAPKTDNSDRTIAMGDGIRALLERLRVLQAERLLPLGEKGQQTGKTPVFDDGIGRYRMPDSVTRAWSRARQRADAEEVQLRHLRDHAATAMIQIISPKDAADRLGHDPATLLDHYARPVTETERRAADLVEKSIGLS